MAWSRSGCWPVRSNRVRSAAPRLGSFGRDSGRVGVGQVSPHGLGDKMRCYRQQRGRPFQAGLQVILILPLGQELISGPVDRNQRSQGLNELGGRYFPIVLGEVLAQV